MKLISSVAFVVLFSFNAVAQYGTEPIAVTDMLKIKTVNNIVLNNDGSKAAFVVTSIEPDENNKLDYKYLNQIYTVATNGKGEVTQLTYAKEGAMQPAWNADGTKLAFVRNAEGKPQIFVLSMNGGEPLQLTKYKYGASNPKWSPNGNQLLFSAGIPLKDLLRDTVLNSNAMLPAWPFEKPGFNENQSLDSIRAKPNPDGNLMEIRAYLNKNEADKKAIVLNKLNFQSETNISSDVSFNHFFIVDVNQPSQPVAITKGFNRFSVANFTPDGKHLIISGDIDSLENPDRSLESEIYMADVDGKNFKMLLGSNGVNYSGASVSTSGKWLAFMYGPTSFITVPALGIMPIKGSAKDIITIPFDRTKSNLTWSSDDKYLYFASQSNGGAPLHRVDVSTKKIETLSDFNSGILAFDIVGDHIVYAKTSVTNPCEIYLADATLKNEIQVSTLNDWVKTKKLSFPEKKTFRNEKGMTVEYWVMKPTNFRDGKKYPLLLDIHGGPSAMWGPGELSMWHEFQYYAAQGYGVVYSNPRGSGGYGLEFLRGNVNDWGTGPTKDVLTALDKAVAEGWADTSRLVVTGGSYAGYLVAWIISHDNRFKAACSQRGVYDLATFFGEGNAWRLVPNYFGGYPWQPKVKELLVRESPITYVQNITTPYIIFHGANDRRNWFCTGRNDVP